MTQPRPDEPQPTVESAERARRLAQVYCRPDETPVGAEVDRQLPPMALELARLLLEGVMSLRRRDKETASRGEAGELAAKPLGVDAPSAEPVTQRERRPAH